MFTKYVSNLEKYIDEPTDKLNDFLCEKVSVLPLTFHYGKLKEIEISEGIVYNIGGKHSIYSFLKQYEPVGRITN